MAKAKKKGKWNGPAPPEGGRGQRSPYPFKGWKVGNTKRYPTDEYDKIRTAVQNLNRTPKVRWRYAKVLENGKQWVRVWRVE